MSSDDKIQRLIDAGILPNPNYVPKEASKNRFGRPCYLHKTGGSLEIFTAESFKATEKYYKANGASRIEGH
jgi:hypothetical protein